MLGGVVSGTTAATGVALATPDCGDVFAAASTAATLYEYVVPFARPLSVWNGVDGDATSAYAPPPELR
jgi:hypothetical protein